MRSNNTPNGFCVVLLRVVVRHKRLRAPVDNENVITLLQMTDTNLKRLFRKAVYLGPNEYTHLHRNTQLTQTL